VIALVIGLVFAFSFDTTGPRVHMIDRTTAERDRTTVVPDEDVHDYRGDDAVRTTDDEVVTTERQPSVAEQIRERDTAAEPVEPAGTTRIDRTTDRT